MVDGPNRYAYVRGNPVDARDPTGNGLLKAGRVVFVEAGPEVAELLRKKGPEIIKHFPNSKMRNRETSIDTMRAAKNSYTEPFREAIRATQEKFPGLQVPYDQAGVPRYSLARDAAGRSPVEATIKIGRFQGDAKSGTEITQAYNMLRETDEFKHLSEEAWEAFKDRTTAHHTSLTDEGLIEFVDSDVHDVFKHGGGSALADLLRETTETAYSLIGLLGVALFEHTAPLLEAQENGESVGATDLVEALATDLALLLTPAGDVKDAHDFFNWLLSEEGGAALKQLDEKFLGVRERNDKDYGSGAGFIDGRGLTPEEARQMWH